MSFRVGPSPVTLPERATHAREVEPTRTPVTKADLRASISRAYEKLTGHQGSAKLIDTLTAHASLETGSGSAMYNYNFGGIKGRGPTGETARCRTKEVIDGKEIEIRDGFRAYRSLDEGAVDYVKLMKDRFGGAVARAEVGDLDGFAHALKKASYYTADETKYATALHRLAGTAGPATASTTAPAAHGGLPGIPGLSFSAGAQSSNAASTFPDTIGLGRVLDAIARHPTTLADPDVEDD